jgi:hypothetical protein
LNGAAGYQEKHFNHFSPQRSGVAPPLLCDSVMRLDELWTWLGWMGRAARVYLASALVRPGKTYNRQTRKG